MRCGGWATCFNRRDDACIASLRWALPSATHLAAAMERERVTGPRDPRQALDARSVVRPTAATCPANGEAVFTVPPAQGWLSPTPCRSEFSAPVDSAGEEPGRCHILVRTMLASGSIAAQPGVSPSCQTRFLRSEGCSEALRREPGCAEPRARRLQRLLQRELGTTRTFKRLFHRRDAFPKWTASPVRHGRRHDPELQHLHRRFQEGC